MFRCHSFNPTVIDALKGHEWPARHIAGYVGCDLDEFLDIISGEGRYATIPPEVRTLARFLGLSVDDFGYMEDLAVLDG